MTALLFHPLPRLLLCVAICSLFAAGLRAQTPGDQDHSFATGPLANSSVYAIRLQPNGQVVVGGRFTTFRGTNRSSGLARLNPDGSLDSLDPGLAISAYLYDSPIIDAVALQPNGQILIGGIFSVLGQTPGNSMARLNADGSLDPTFNVGAGGSGFGAAVETITVLPNGQMLVGGSFTSFNGYNTGSLVRLNADGSLDITFNPDGTGLLYNSIVIVSAIVVQPNGKILVGGQFNEYNGASVFDIVRLNADGTLDTSFNTGTGTGDDSGAVTIEAVALQPDGQIIIGGSFSTFNGASVPHVVRLHADGSLDLTYDPVGAVTIAEASAIVLQPDGKALVGGHVNTSGGQLGDPGDGLARINPDGTLDASFNSEGSAFDVIAFAPQSDGRVLCAGNSFGGGLRGETPGDVFRIYDLANTVAPSTPTATIAAGVARTNEDGSSGPATFIVSLGAAQGTKTVVRYSVKGSAVPGFDYQTLSGKVKIKPGETSATISVYPYENGINDGSVVAVKAVLQASSGYAVGAANTAKVKIVDNE